MPEIEHRYLRSAIEFAVASADAGQRRRPPLAYPSALEPFLKQTRIPASALGRLRRAIEGDGEFRTHLASLAAPEKVDQIGVEWLRRDDGWESRVADLVASAQRAKEQEGTDAALRREEKRREGAEQAATRARAKESEHRARIDELSKRVEALQQQAGATAAEVKSLRAELAAARTAARHANDREEAVRRRVEGLVAERDEGIKRAELAEAQRDALLAERAERAGVRIEAGRVGELGELARSARTLADRLGGFVEVPAGRRRPLALPGGVAGDSPKATEFLLRARGALVLVDGYNVAKLAWPDEELALQRRRCLDIVDDVARRFGSEMAVVFDGADVIGSHSEQRRLARVTYSPPGVSADDVIRAEVETTSPGRSVVVVTNDQAVRRDVAKDGANLIRSDSFLAVAR